MVRATIKDTHIFDRFHDVALAAIFGHFKVFAHVNIDAILFGSCLSHLSSQVLDALIRLRI